MQEGEIIKIDLPVKWYVSALLGIYRTFKLGKRFPRVVAQVRTRILAANTIKHHLLAHAIRKLSLCDIEDYQVDDLMLSRFNFAADSICDLCCDLIANLMQIAPNDLHCSLKLFTNNTDQKLVAVTVGRSPKRGDRPSDYGLENAHEIAKNSVFATLYGTDKGLFINRPCSCFTSNNLPSHRDQFLCDRADYDRYYQSVMVFPLRYENIISGTYEFIGCLTFDRPRKNGFDGLPDIFAFSDFHDYHNRLTESVLWHQGAVLADMLSSVLHLILWPKEKET